MDLERKLNGGRRVNPSLTDTQQPVCNYSSKWGITWDSTSPPIHKCNAKLLEEGAALMGTSVSYPVLLRLSHHSERGGRTSVKSQRQQMSTRELLSGHSRRLHG